jgi:hypothetical protein
MTYIRKIMAYSIPGVLVSLLLVDTAFAQLKNPLAGGGIDSLPKFVENVLKIMVMIALPIITLFMVYSGALFIFAQGNQEKLAKAKTNFLFVVIGSVLILGAWVFASLIGSTIKQLTG